ncbi:DUF998 domain-containing protein [Flavobacterium lipolyticum]|uniref:DUF998 domain-containing protein n=1 Tax=Flavobacterium lipolyticum TaxID=2893754 RepID=A0ABS8M0T9_9FLAO|nr:DUF998 domain-containing protein [Flavobacterium sp. F-126]MCC9018410.1 DUF998 domain-containing protein [Flavobacterium sp. F-126]
MEKMKTGKTVPFNWVRAAAVMCIITCISDFVVLFVLGSCYQGYSQLRNTISSLGATISPVSKLISAWWILIGIVFVFFGVFFRKAFEKDGRYVKLASLLIVMYGLGEGIGSGLFKADSINGKRTFSFLLHDIVGGIGIIAAVLLPLVMCSVISKEDNSPFYCFSWIVFIIGSITLLCFGIRFPSEAGDLIASCKGLWQRLFLLNLYVYFIAISVIMYNRKIPV